MAIVYGTDYTNSFQSSGSGAGFVATARAGGRVRAIVDDYTVVAATAQNDVVVMGGALLPDGCNVIDAWLDHDAMGTSVTLALAVATGGSTSAIIAAASASSAAVKTPNQGTLPIPITQSAAGDGQIQVTIGGADPTATRVITVCIFYMID